MDTESGFIKVDDGHLFYEVSGRGEALVFIHGMGLDLSIWDYQFDYFAKHFKVIRYDLRGFGRSSVPKKKYTHINDLLEILNCFKIKDANIVGLSMGGDVSLDFAENYPMYVKSLILVGSALNGHFPLMDREIMKINLEIEEKVRHSKLESARKLWLNLPYFEHALKVEESRELVENISNNYSFWHYVNVNPIKQQIISVKERLNEINCPTFILIGEHDLNPLHQISEILHLKIKGSEKYIVPHTGHFPNIENKDDFNFLINKFLSRVNGNHNVI